VIRTGLTEGYITVVVVHYFYISFLFKLLFSMLLHFYSEQVDFYY
jgi:hypothetical protein